MPGMYGIGGGKDGTLIYNALYDYDARTYEDLTFRKGNRRFCVCLLYTDMFMCAPQPKSAMMRSDGKDRT